MQLLLEYRMECANCGEELIFGRDSVRHDSEGRPICSVCVENDYEECLECGELHNYGDMTYVESVNGHVCDDCLNRYYERCELCEEYHNSDDMHFAHGTNLCDSCHENNFYCIECCEWHPISEIEDSRICGANRNDRVCESCYDNYYRHCDDCGCLVNEDQAEYNESNDAFYCPNCSCNHEDGEPDCNGVYGYHEFGDDNYSRRLSRKENLLPWNEQRKIISLGVELESDEGRFDGSGFCDWTDEKLIHFEHDGSLSYCGVECITQPCSLKYHQREMGWDGICGTLVSQGFKSHNTSNCGLHVHIGREQLNPSTVVKMDYFLHHSKYFMEMIARRKKVYGGDYDVNKKFDIRKASRWGTHDDRYAPLNTTNSETVEVRIFRGSLKPETVLGCIEMCHAMVKFLDVTSFDDLLRIDLAIRRFIDFCGENADVYPHVIPMFHRRLVKCGDNTYIANVAFWKRKLDDREYHKTEQFKNEIKERMKKKCA